MRDTFGAQVARIKDDARPFWIGGGNDAERAFARLVESSGGTPMKTGWPDIAIFGKDDCLKAIVEVKPEEGRRGHWQLRSEQLVMLAGLASFGLPCFIWSCEAGLTQINPDRTTKSVEMDALTVLL